MPERAEMSLHRLESVSKGAADIVSVEVWKVGRGEQTRVRERVAREDRGRLAAKAMLATRAGKVIGKDGVKRRCGSDVKVRWKAGRGWTRLAGDAEIGNWDDFGSGPISVSLRCIEDFEEDNHVSHVFKSLFRVPCFSPTVTLPFPPRALSATLVPSPLTTCPR